MAKPSRLDDLKSYLAYLDKKQVLLENAKSKFDANVFGAKAEVTRLTNQLRSLADQVEKCTLGSIDDLAFARREEFSTISNNLAMSFRTAYVIFEKSKAASESGDNSVMMEQRQALLDLDKTVEQMISDKDEVALQTMEIVPSPDFFDICNKLPPSRIINVMTSVMPTDIVMKISQKSSAESVVIDIMMAQGVTLPRVLYPAVVVTIKNMCDEAKIICGPLSLKQALQNNLLKVNPGGGSNFVLTCPLTTPDPDGMMSDILVSLTMNHQEVSMSPQIISQENKWKTVGGPNSTLLNPSARGIRRIPNDLDESDLKSIELDKTKGLVIISALSPVKEEPVISSKSQTPFEQIVTANSPKKNVNGSENNNSKMVLASDEATVQFHPCSLDLVQDSKSLSSRPSSITGESNVSSTTYRNCPSPLADSVWNMGNSTWDQYNKDVNAKLAEINKDTYDRHMKQMENNMWEGEYNPEDAEEPGYWPMEAKKAKIEGLDLSDAKNRFVHMKTLNFTEYDGKPPKEPFVTNPKKAMPQTIARDASLDRTYISDSAQHVIHLYEGYKYLGIWPPGKTFQTPRTVITIPPPLGVHKGLNGMNVLVLDDQALYFFKASGENRWEDGSVMLEGKASRFRGLAFVENNTVVTTEKTTEGVNLVFIDIMLSRKIIDRISLVPTTLSDYQIQKTKCVNVASDGKRVFTSDFGLKCFYDTDIETKQTRSVYSSKADRYITGIMGIAVDPAGNVLVSVVMPPEPGSRPCIELFSSAGIYKRRIELPPVLKPVGVLLEGKSFYVADVGARTVEIFQVLEQ